MSQNDCSYKARAKTTATGGVRLKMNLTRPGAATMRVALKKLLDLDLSVNGAAINNLSIEERSAAVELQHALELTTIEDGKSVLL